MKQSNLTILLFTEPVLDDWLKHACLFVKEGQPAHVGGDVVHGDPQHTEKDNKKLVETYSEETVRKC